MAGDERGAVWSSATMTCLLSFTALGASYFLPLVLLQWRYAFIKGKRPKSSLAPKLKVGMPEHISAFACRLPCVHVWAHVQFVLFLNSALSSERALNPANKATDASTTPVPQILSMLYGFRLKLSDESACLPWLVHLQHYEMFDWDCPTLDNVHNSVAHVFASLYEMSSTFLNKGWFIQGKGFNPGPSH